MDLPDRSKVPIIGTSDGVVIVVVPLTLAEQKQLLVAARWSILDALWLTVRLVPDDVSTQKPTSALERKRQ